MRLAAMLPLAGLAFVTFGSMPALAGQRAMERPATPKLPVTPASLKAPAPRSDRIQYVLISFDGAEANTQWDRSLAIAAESGARFTYFLSCTGLISWKDHMTYKGPGHAAGRSNVGFASSREDIATRLSNMWTAHLEGNEIGSHGCGHFDGKKWTAAEWEHELSTFRKTVRDAWTANGAQGEPKGWKAFAEHGIVGFRAPYLSKDAALDDALKASGFLYSASGVSRGPVLPGHADGVTQFSLPTIPEGPRGRRIIAMDYNLYVRHSDGKEDVADADRFEARAYTAFDAAFEKQYRGPRTPLQIGFHFTLMNGGAYWRALERFAVGVCDLPDVRCTTYSEYMKETGMVPPAAGNGTPDRGPA